MIVLVCGGRDYQNRGAVFEALDEINSSDGVDVVVHGACCKFGSKTELRGADRWAQEWAQEREIPYTGVPAQWVKLGKRAGMERNGRMLAWAPDAVVGFPGGSGTQNMCDQAEAAGIVVWRPYGP